MGLKKLGFDVKRAFERGACGIGTGPSAHERVNCEKAPVFSRESPRKGGLVARVIAGMVWGSNGGRR